MAIARLSSQDIFALSLEDMFSSVGALESKLAQAQQWEGLRRHAVDRALFEYSAEWASEIFSRLVTALDRRAMDGDSPNASGVRSARLFVAPEGQRDDSVQGLAGRPELVAAQEHCITSDLKRALATGSTAFPRSQILSDRKEGRFLASVEAKGKWFAVSKVLLTTSLCEGKDALITDVPAAVVEVLRLTCPELLEIAKDG
jgi:hypothetical protein